MKNGFFLILTFLFSVCAKAQFQDDFSDGDFTDNPPWLGNTDVFIVNASNELQLNDVTGGVSYLYASAPHADSTVWDFYVRLEFAPSSSNFARVYLSSDQPDLDGPLNGYFVRIGGESGTGDKLELFRQEGTTTTSLISGTAGAVGNDPAEARVRVRRDDGGNWELLADYSGGNTLISEGNATDNTFSTGDFFGAHCTYTATRADKFFFDDIMVSPIFMDMIPPDLIRVEAVSSTEVEVEFNEPVSQPAAENILNYNLDGQISVINASVDGGNPALVLLTVNPALVSGQSYTLSTSGVADLNGNAVPPGSPLSQTFTFYDIQEPGALDIIISELLPDDNPSIGLPEAEFIEIYNNTSFAFDLENFSIERINLVSGTSKEAFLPEKLFLPQTFIVLCASADASLFEAFTDPENILGLSNFSSFLPNDDDAVYHFKNAVGSILHSVDYTQSLYNGMDADGLTLELINPDAACLGIDNWRPSVHPDGGTPGQENSVFDPAFGNVPPSLTGLTQISDTELLLNFDKSLDEVLAEDPDLYELSGGPLVVSPDDAAYDSIEKSVLLTFLSPFADGTQYTITVLNGVQDCLGNAVADPNQASFTFVETQPAGRYDILINEIYPDPNPSNGLPEKEFIELYNRSDKNINLKDFLISDRSAVVTLPDFILFPGEFVILYEAGGPGYSVYGDTIPLPDFVGLGNEEDDLTLISPEGRVIDAVFYNRTWYQNTGKDEGGWSIERINPNRPCEGQANWRAALNIPGGTPGAANSVLETDPDETLPDLIKAFPVSDFEVRLTFSEAMDDITAGDIDNYALDATLGNVTFAELEPPHFNTVLLGFTNAMETGTIYTVTTSQLEDCTGNLTGMMNTARFAVPESIEAGDLIINELLFDPVTGGTDFVEVVNISDKVVNVDELIFANRGFDGNIGQTVPVEGDCLLFPDDYVVFTPDPVLIKSQYMTTNPNGFVEVDLPSYPDFSGDVVLVKSAVIGSEIIDEFHYEDDYHFELLDDEDGVSLERILLGGDTQDPSNWHSAAESVGFATPAYQNSQFFAAGDPVASQFGFSEASFSPDNDGFKDFLLLQYDLDQPGYLANIWIFDGKGRQVHTLTRNELLGTSGSIQWDGITDDGTKARLGIYVMYIEVFDLNGNVSRFKEPFVLGGKL